jgi:hypothetical protein
MSSPALRATLDCQSAPVRDHRVAVITFGAVGTLVGEQAMFGLGSMRRRWLSPIAAIGCVLAFATSAFAYGPQVVTTITVTPSSATFRCNHPERVTATVLDVDGQPIKGVIVTWDIAASPSSADRVLQADSKTDKRGVAKTMVKLACVAGDRTISASAGGVTGSAVVHVSLNKPGKGPDKATLKSLANASAVTVESPAPTVPVPLFAAALVVAGTLTLLVRRVLNHR